MFFLDDLLITGTSKSDHFHKLELVLKKLDEAGLTVKQEKCIFFAKSVKYLGYIIDEQGIKTDPDEIKSINEVSTPKDVPELKQFLGLINYYGKFIKT